jgi:hypothetical protein
MIQGQSIIIIYVVLIAVYAAGGDQYYESSLGRYIGDNNSTDIFKRELGKQKMIGILFTNKNCRDCYYYDEELANIITKVWV